MRHGTSAHLHVDTAIGEGDNEEGDESDSEDEVLALVVRVLHVLAVVDVTRHAPVLVHVGQEHGTAPEEGDSPDDGDDDVTLGAAETGGVVQRVHDGHVVVHRHGQQVEQRDEHGHGVEGEVEGAGAGEGQAVLGRGVDGRSGQQDTVQQVAQGAQAQRHVGQSQADHQLQVCGQCVGPQQRRAERTEALLLTR